ncbi:thioredoxin family protein [Mycoplasmopsis cricetuli]|uniref:thioredoxin family protein n=1 Tax=Mycoplasmopsis cricetuli TaxID=171283 RepID=UPI00046F3EE8|nr:thioredoxin family protein [Mycoplasmopsis cricetuli]
MLREVTKKEVMETIKNGFHLVVFHAVWCGACKMLRPELEKLASEDNVSILTVNINENNEYAKEENVMSIPYILFYKDGVLVDKVVGSMPYAQLKEKITYLSK